MRDFSSHSLPPKILFPSSDTSPYQQLGNKGNSLRLTILPMDGSPHVSVKPIIGPKEASALSDTLEFKTPLPRTAVTSCLAALLYATVAIAMNFVNKWTVQIFPLANVVLILQMLATLAILQPLIALKALSFPAFSRKRARQLMLICQLYTANTAFALYGLRTLNVPMYSTIKRLTPMAILVIKAIITRKAPSRTITAAVLLVVFGTIVAGAGDLTFDITGYSFALLSCATQAAYLVLTEFKASEGISTPELLYYNAITSLPTLALITVATGEAAQLPQALRTAADAHGTWQVVVTLITCSLMGCLLNYSLFLCTMLNSALTTTIVGVLKGVIAVVLGFFLLGGAPIHPVNIAGITLNTAGGIWYTIHKFRSRAHARAVDERTLLASPSLDAIRYDNSPRADGGASLEKMRAVERRGGWVSHRATPKPAVPEVLQPLLAR